MVINQKINDVRNEIQEQAQGKLVGVKKLADDLAIQQNNVRAILEKEIKDRNSTYDSELKVLRNKQQVELTNIDNQLKADLDKVRKDAEATVRNSLQQISSREKINQYKNQFKMLVPNFESLNNVTLPEMNTYSECYQYFQNVSKDMSYISRIKRVPALDRFTTPVRWAFPFLNADKFESLNTNNLALGLINVFTISAGVILFPYLVILPVLGIGGYLGYTSLRNINVGLRIKANVIPFLVNYEQLNRNTIELYVEESVGGQIRELKDKHSRERQEKEGYWSNLIKSKLTEIENYKKNLNYEQLQESRLKEFTERYKRDLDNLNLQSIENQKSLSDKLSKLQKEFDETKERLDDLLSQFQTCFQRKPNDKSIMESNFHIGYEFEQTVKAKIPHIIDFQNEPIMMVYRNDNEKRELVNLAKYIVCQIQSQMKVTNLKTNVYDAKDLGSMVNDIGTTENYTNIYTDKDEIRDILKSQIEEISYRNTKYLRGFSDIEHFNNYMIHKDSAPLNYFLNLMVNLENNSIFDSMFYSFISQSSRVGIFNIVLVDANQFKERGEVASERLELRNQFKWIFEFKERGVTLVNTLNKPSLPVSYQFPEINGIDFVNFSNEMNHKYKTNQIDLLYASELIERSIGGEEQFWKGSTKDGIDVCFGYVDGDKDQIVPISFNDEHAHGLMGGVTGSGKSNVINVMLDYAKKKYSPTELELYMADFKVVEFSTYAKPHKLAHATAIAATRDVDYCISLFDKLIEEMTRRESLFKAHGVVNIKEYRDKGFELPRILFIVDEFQQLFLIDDEVSMIAKDRIEKFAKLGRATGVHLFFTSQSMAKTVSADILDMFRLRIALGSSRDVSKDLIGNDGASQISRGYAIVNVTAEGKKEDNVLYRVPFIPTDYRFEGNRLTRELGKKRNIPIKNAVFFNQDETKSIEWLEEELIPKVKGFKDNKVILLGDPTVFTTSPYPKYINLGEHENSNILLLGKEPEMLGNLCKIVISSLKSKDKAVFVLQDNNPQLSKVYDIKADLNPKLTFVNSLLPSPEYASIPNKYPNLKFGHWLTTYKDYVEHRLHLYEKGEFNAQEENSLYFICNGFNSIDGLGRGDRDYAVDDVLGKYLISGGIVKVHVIFIGSDMSTGFGYRFAPMFNYRIFSSLTETSAGVMGSSKSAKKYMEIEKLFYQVQDIMKSEEFKVMGYDAGMKSSTEEEEGLLEVEVPDIFEFFG